MSNIRGKEYEPREHDPDSDEIQPEGIGIARDILMNWLARYAKSPEALDQMKLVLYQVAKHGGEQSLDVFYYERDRQKPLDAVVDELLKEAATDCKTLTGRVKYAVRVDGDPKARKTFMLATPDSEPGEDRFNDDTHELPDLRGIVHQMMRHTEVCIREMVMSSRMDRSVLLSVLSEYRSELREARRNPLEQMAVAERLVNMDFARTIRTDEYQRRQKRKDLATKVLIEKGPDFAKKVFPGIVQAITGKKMPQQQSGGGGAGNGNGHAPPQQPPSGGGPIDDTVLDAAPVEDLMDAFLASAEKDEQKVRAFVQSLEPAAQQIFVAMYRRVAKRRDERGTARPSTDGGDPGSTAAPTTG